ncbi:YbaB/EbfC family nucleoid-associated protein [Frankia nepalensis]
MSNPAAPGSFGDMGGDATPGFGSIIEQAQKMQAALLVAQQELAEARVDGDAGGGLVTATVNGGGELVGLTISPKAVDPADTETLADLILAAVRDATTNAHKLAEQKMAAATGGLGGMLGSLGGGLGGPGLPGLPGLPGAPGLG